MHPIRPTLAAALAATALAASSLLGAPAAVAQSSFEGEVVALLNQERARLGRSPLGTDLRLFTAAEGHAAWMCAVQLLSHTGSGGSSPGTRATAAGYRWFAIGETIAQGYPSPASVVAGFRGSASHWTILMSASYRDIGAGYVACEGRSRMHYWSLMVANSRDAATPVGGGAPEPTATTRPAPTATPRLAPTATAGPVLPPAPPPTATPPPAAPPPSGSGAVFGTVRLAGAASPEGTAILLDGALRARASGSGAFVVQGVAAGAHLLRAEHPGWLSSARTLVVAGGAVNAGATTLLAGDLARNDAVDYDDFRALFGTWGRCRGQAGYDAVADYDGDGCVGYGDYFLMRPNYRLIGPTAWR